MCKVCISKNICKTKEEENLSFQGEDYIYTKKNISSPKVSNTFKLLYNTRKKRNDESISLRSNNNSITNNNNLLKKLSKKFANNNSKDISTYSSSKIIPNLEDEDQKQLNKIIKNYHVKIVSLCFNKLKQMKKEAHKTIQKRKNFKELYNYINSEGEGSLDLNLFPEQIYDYLGNIVDNKKDGFGIQYFLNSDSKYVGQFLDDYRIGFCYFENKSQSYIYKGETKKNLTGLYGIYCNYKKNLNYEGEWFNNRKEGIGIESYYDNSFYMGEFHNGKKNGIGTYYWNDGSIYEGEWNNNLLEGKGIYKFKDGCTCFGEWSDNKLNGFAKFTYLNKCYIGFFKNDYQCGFGFLFFFGEKKAYVGFWKKNKQNGFGKIINGDNIKYGFWQEGNKISTYEKNVFYNILDNKNISKKYKIFLDMDYEKLCLYANNFTG